MIADFCSSCEGLSEEQRITRVTQYGYVSMYDSILVPTDGSDGTMLTLDHALDLAERHDATIHAMYVVDRRPFLLADEDVEDEVLESLYSEGETAVTEVSERAETVGVPVITEIREGIPDKDIIQYTEEYEIDVIVLGTHGRTGRDKLTNLGSVTERVIKNAQIPVFVIHIGVNPSNPD